MPMRTCVSCRRVLKQAELNRLRRDADGRWVVEQPGKHTGGRGAWVCDRAECREIKGLGRFFRAQAARIAEELSAAASPHQRNEG